MKTNSKNLITILFFATIAFFVYSYLNFAPTEILNSPDETANYFFSKQLSQTGEIGIYEELNQKIGNPIIHPRSTQVINDRIVPSSFLGMSLIYGSLGKIFNYNIILFLTPFFAALGIIFFYLLIKKIWGERVSFLSTILLLFLPAWWYYSSRVMFHNVLFMSFLIISAYFIFCFLHKERLLYYILAGLFVGLAVITRSSEIFWMLGCAMISFISQRKKIRWSYLFIFFAIIFLCFAPVFYFNNLIYDSPLSIGYGLEQSGDGVSLQNAGNLAQQLLLPFGFHEKAIAKNLYNYGFQLFWWFAIPVIFGIFLFLIKFKKASKNQKLYFGLFSFSSIYLIIVYGSWVFNDNPDPNAITIGTSYVRYWLPIFVFALPFVGYLFKEFATRSWKKSIIAIAFALMMYFSYNLVIQNPEEGLKKIKQNLISYKNTANQVFELTEKYSVIISGSADKIFWPERKVIYNLYNDRDIESVNKLLQNEFPVYYYNITFPKQDIEYLNNKKFRDYNFRISNPISEFGELSLYKLEEIKKAD